MNIVFKCMSVLCLTLWNRDVLSQEIPTDITVCCDIRSEARCTGSAYCTACSNCSRCKHCSNGGSCGVCSGNSRNTKSPKKYERKKTNSKSSSVESPGYYNGSSKYKEKHKTSSPLYQKSKGHTNSMTESTVLYVNAEELNMRSGPGTEYKIIEKLSRNQRLRYIDAAGEWYKVLSVTTQQTGYVHSKYVEYTGD